MKKWFNEHISLIAITLLITALTLLGVSLVLRILNKIDNINPLILIFGNIFTVFGIVMTLYDHDKKPKRGFEMVDKNMRKQKYFHMPTRGTKFSAGYDFYSPEEYIVKPNEIVKIWTDVKAYMQSNEFLMLDVRSSLGGKFMLANTIGIIDSDYYGNSNNDGNIGIFLKNISEQTQIIKKDDRIAQGVFLEYFIADNDYYNSEIRKGGHGSTNESNNA